MEFSRLLSIANSKYAKLHGKQENENGIEESENSEVIDNVGDHGHNIGQAAEYSQEEESLGNGTVNGDNQNNLALNRVWIEDIIESNTRCTCPNEQEVSVVPKF